MRHRHMGGRLLDKQHGFHHQALAVLHILAHRMEVGGNADAVGHQAFTLLAFTLAV